MNVLTGTVWVLHVVKTLLLLHRSYSETSLYYLCHKHSCESESFTPNGDGSNEFFPQFRLRSVRWQVKLIVARV
jgi:hypothetical protein